ncbi:MAG: TonB-dependent receptor [Sphingomonas fennica]
MRSRFDLHLLSLLAGSALTAAAGSAAAQTAPAPSGAVAVPSDTTVPAGIDQPSTEAAGTDIVITARRREESAQTVPIAVTAFNDTMIREKSIVSTQDLTQVTPGLNVAPQSSRDTPTLVIRGQRRAVSGAGAPAVVTYFQDVPLPNEGSLLPTFDIGSLQVLKGPQGTLFGRNTTGGALLVYAKAPVYDLEGYVEGTLGRYDERKIEGAINLPIIDQKLAVRVAGQVWRRDGYTRNIGVGPDLDDIHNDAIRVSVLAEPVEGLKNVAVFDYYRAREAGTGAILNGTFPNPAVPGGGNARTAAARPFFDCGVRGCDIDIALADQRARGVRVTDTSISPLSRRDFWGVANTTTFDAGAVTIKNIFGYRSTNIVARRDGDGSGLRLSDGYSRADSTQVSDELQLLGSLMDDKLDWIVGGFYLKSKPDGVVGGWTLAPIFPGQFPSFNENYITTESKALFGQVGYDLGALADGLKANAGFRYTWDKSSGCTITRLSTLGFAGEDGCRTAGGRQGRESSKAPTWTLGLDYQVSRALFLYVTNRRGYRSGGFNQSGLAPSLAPYESYEPEKVTDYEAGIKSQWSLGRGARARFNLSAYTSEYANIQRGLTPGGNFDGDNNPANDPNSLIINAAKATIRGFEFDGALTFGGLTLSGFGAYTDAYYTRFDAIPVFVPLLGTNPVANRFSYTPEWTLGGGLRYARPLGDDIGTFVFNANYFFADKTWFVERPFDTNGIENGYKVTNLRAELNGIGGSGVDVSAFVRNVFNRTFATAGGIITPAVTATTKIYNEPRVYGIQARFTFGGR